MPFFFFSSLRVRWVLQTSAVFGAAQALLTGKNGPRAATAGSKLASQAPGVKRGNGFVSGG